MAESATDQSLWNSPRTLDPARLTGESLPMTTTTELEHRIDQSLALGHPDRAAAYLAQWVHENPNDHGKRRALAVSLGDAGQPALALKIFVALANHLMHLGQLLSALVVIRHALNHAPADPRLTQALETIHARGQENPDMADLPPPLTPSETPDAVQAETLLALEPDARWEAIAQAGLQFPPSEEACIPLPVPVFSKLSTTSFLKTVPKLQYRKVSAGAVIIEEGAPGDTMMVVASGHVMIVQGGEDIAKLGPGMVVGEMALLTASKRSASVKAHEDMEYVEFSRADLGAIAKEHPAIATELRTYCYKRLLSNLYNSSPLFKQLDYVTGVMLLDDFKPVGFQPGSVLIQAGEQGRGVWVVATGRVEVTVVEDGQTVLLATLGPGNVIGEISLVQGQKTSATVTARDKVGALFLDKEKFLEVTADNPTFSEWIQNMSQERLEQMRQMNQVAEAVADEDLMVL
ncbi:MAG: cyclic nucleotide-binding domain-containing protein [Deltaproteobacteria bacterium]|jgi:CRP-like cAMP-binding protein|nr:cyclic nucleotide-binding domain-containing protein [Deltaproteobacteria bacterium]